MSPATKDSVFVRGGRLGRRGAQRGLGGPCKRRDALQPPSGRDRVAAGRLAPISALFVNHDAFASLIPHALNWAQIGSVPEPLVAGDMV